MESNGLVSFHDLGQAALSPASPRTPFVQRTAVNSGAHPILLRTHALVNLAPESFSNPNNDRPVNPEAFKRKPFIRNTRTVASSDFESSLSSLFFKR